MTHRILNAKLSVILCYFLLFVADDAGAQGGANSPSSAAHAPSVSASTSTTSVSSALFTPSSPTDVSASVPSTRPKSPHLASEPATESSQSCILSTMMDMCAHPLSYSAYNSSHLLIHICFISSAICPTYPRNVPLSLAAVAPAARVRADPRLWPCVGFGALSR